MFVFNYLMVYCCDFIEYCMVLLLVKYFFRRDEDGKDTFVLTSRQDPVLTGTEERNYDSVMIK